MPPARGVHAQEVVGKYVNADGSSTGDLEAATATWRADETFQGNWGLGAIKAEYAYARGYTGQGVKLGIFDTGIDRTHPKFAKPGKLLTLRTQGTYAYTWINSMDASQIYTHAGDPFDLDGGVPYEGIAHGTHVGGIAAAPRDGGEMQGVAPGATVVAANNGDAGPEFGDINSNDAASYVAGFDALIGSGVRIINNSWGIGWREDERAGVLGEGLIKQYAENPTQGAIEGMTRAAKAKILMVFAGGEDENKGGDVTNTLPLFRPEVEDYWINVNALMRYKNDRFIKANELLTGWWGSDDCGLTKYYCVSAPGDEILSTVLEGGYDYNSGTSMAAPNVTGSLAVLMERYPYLANAEIRQILLTTATPLGNGASGIPDTVHGWGMVNLERAVNGPSQFLDRFNAPLGEGVVDTWSNNISQLALDQRKLEERAEIAAWEKRKIKKGWPNVMTEATLRTSLDQGFTPESVKNTAALIDEVSKADERVQAAKKAGDTENYNKAQAVSLEAAEVLANASVYQGMLDRFDATKLLSAKTPEALQLLVDEYVQQEIASAPHEYTFMEKVRIPYLAAKLADPLAYLGGLTKSGAGSLWLTGTNSYRGDTIINGGELGIGAGGSIASPSIVNATGLLTVDGEASSVMVNAGGRLKVNASGLTGDVTLNNGVASVDGTSGGTVVKTGGRLSGNGRVGGLVVADGGIVSPGHSIGTLHVNGDARFDKGSKYDIEIDSEEHSDRLDVTGTATLLGGVVYVHMDGQSVHLDEQASKTLLGKGYTILTAEKLAPESRFEGVNPQVQFNYISPFLDYPDTRSVRLRFDYTQTAKTEMAQKLADELAAARHMEDELRKQATAPAQTTPVSAPVPPPEAQPDNSGPESAQVRAVDRVTEVVETKEAARAEDVHPNVPQKSNVAAIEAASKEVERLEAELRAENMGAFVPSDATTRNQKSVWGGIKSLGTDHNPLFYRVVSSKSGETFNYDALSGEVHASLKGALVEDNNFVRDASAKRIRSVFETAGTALWGEAYGSWSHADGNSNASGYIRNTGGFVTGFDEVIADTWRIGLLTGYGNTSLNTQRGHASVDSYQLGIYGGTRIDALTLSLGTSLARHEIDTRRKVAFGDVSNRNIADYSANAVQVFGEAAYHIDTPYAALEPFAAAAYTHLKTDGFTETGGITALTARSDTTDLTTTTLGLRASYSMALGEKTMLTARGMAGWKHAFGDVTPQASMVFSGGNAFSVDGLAAATDTALVEAGLDLDIGNATTIGVSYNGQLSARGHDNAIKADLSIRF